MKHSHIRAARALLLAVVVALVLVGCKTTPNPTLAGITVDTSSFVLHNENIYASQNANDYNNAILVMDVTYTNHDPIPQAMSPEHFVLIDQNTLAQYRALDGGDIHIPNFAIGGLLDPGKPVDLSLGFRVPMGITVARLSYSP
ncbi:MAG TPA: hypothetical protein VKF82_00585 [Candidatus Eremiobacteraceae bacterium]|nr:hypothetical protein [Candidatus Eremiobacteraceae bacterium]